MPCLDCVMSLLLCSLLSSCSGISQCRLDQRRVTVADTIEMTELSRPEPESSAHPGDLASFSPDGSHFAVIVKKGNIQDDANLYVLRVYSTADAFKTPKPEAILTMASNSNRPAIAELHWLRDGHTLLFLGEEPNTSAQIYSFDLLSRQLRRLTSQPTSVVRYDASDNGSVIVFETEPPPEDIVDTPATRRSAFVLTGQELSTVLFSGYRSAQSMAFHSRQLFIMRQKEKPKAVRTPNGIWPFLMLSVSPGGRYAVLGDGAVVVRWTVADSKEQLVLAANLHPAPHAGFPASPQFVLWREGDCGDDGGFGPFAVCWSIETVTGTAGAGQAVARSVETQ